MELARVGLACFLEDALLRQYHVTGRGTVVEVPLTLTPPPDPNPGGLSHAQYLVGGDGTWADDGLFRQYVLPGSGAVSETATLLPPVPPPLLQLHLAGGAAVNEDALLRLYHRVGAGALQEVSQGSGPPGGPVVGGRLAVPAGGLKAGRGRLVQVG